MNKRYKACIVLIVLYILTFFFRWLAFGQVDTFSLEMIVIVLIVMCVIYLLYKYK
ncbi:MAG: hypothetical protein KHZ15_02730 [Coprobacillus cateniformis]|uniref:hypothetical protein n=1 Tax=Longibaculum muris TaxID=1796628 RepID=UPI003AB24F28|nr:hypothetical protein [Coprobacillus cateniformis]